MSNIRQVAKNMQKPNIYLDIDGVILANEDNLSIGAEELIKYAVENFDVYWLTTHCTESDATHAINYVMRAGSESLRQHLEKLIPTSWREYKTEAIDFSKPFLWFDDDCYLSERRDLEKNNAFNSWIEVDLRNYPDQLMREIKLLESFVEDNGK
ncbi:MAG: hypothetical protein WCP56_01635 [Candidatus Saccharibacteria bacterium]